MSPLSVLDQTETVHQLEVLASSLKELQDPALRFAFLKQELSVVEALTRHPDLLAFCEENPIEFSLVLTELIAISQLDFSISGDQIKEWIKPLIDVERFYAEKGGLIGYQSQVLQKIKRLPIQADALLYHSPCGIDLCEDSIEVRQAICSGLKNLPFLAEIYPVGGAADRLQLIHPDTLQPLPAAFLPFLGKTLLEGLVRDLQGREYLYYQLYQKQLMTPIALMTSEERGNHEEIYALCRDLDWFCRDSKAFMFFQQPQVPVVDRKGEWVKGQEQFLLRPGGHGALWKVAENQGVFKWLLDLKREKVLIRQINNPIAGVDLGLLGFTGVGFNLDAAFGFASCPRQVKAAEGINVVIEKRKENHSEFCLTNVEYCDFSLYGIEDVPESSETHYSKFPSNTNILFADIGKVKEAVAIEPLPGLVLNFKKIGYVDETGTFQEKDLARLESMMQNIADLFTCEETLEHLPTFITHNARSKTISTTKRQFQLGGSFLETPQGCYLDVLANAYDLLSNHCKMQLPPREFGSEGFPFHVLYHPALGPLYQIIGQKISLGSLGLGSELQLEIAELKMENVHLQGSLLIRAENSMGHLDEEGILRYSDKVGRCLLSNVTVCNQGIDRTQANVFWKNSIFRKEMCEIVLEGESEFIAEDICLEGAMSIHVPDGQRARAFMLEGKVQILYEKLEKASWNYAYKLNPNTQTIDLFCS